jgi:hypothetical protein
MNYTDITSSEIACEFLKREFLIPDLSILPVRQIERIVAGLQLENIADAINKLSDFDILKEKFGYTPFFINLKTGFVFYDSIYNYWDTYSFVLPCLPSNFHFKTRAESDFFGKTFLELHKKVVGL